METVRPRYVGEIFIIALLIGCSGSPAPVQQKYQWSLPSGFPAPATTGMTPARVQLGRHLFYDPRLSANGTQSCSTCHQQERAFTDGRPLAIGSTGAHHTRNSQTLTNVAYNASYTWDRASVRTLEEQARIPMFGDHPIELGWEGSEREILARIREDDRYQRLFGDASMTVTTPNIIRALAAFERTLISGRSAYDQRLFADADSLSPEAWRGMKLFFSERLACSSCHRGFNFSGPVHYAGSARFKPTLHESVIAPRKRFRIPTLRNVALTAPYMHDGSVSSLAAVLDRYDTVRKLALSDVEKSEVIAFLESLTDEEFVNDSRFSNPW